MIAQFYDYFLNELKSILNFVFGQEYSIRRERAVKIQRLSNKISKKC